MPQAVARVVCILRRGVMDERAAAIVATVWHAWDVGHQPTLGQMAQAAGLSAKSTVFNRLRVLERRGWVTLIDLPEGHRATRGPRLMGLDHGWPLEQVGAWQDVKPSRTAKWDRRSVLVEKR